MDTGVLVAAMICRARKKNRAGKSGPLKTRFGEMSASKAYLGPAHTSPGGWGAEESELATSRTLRHFQYGELPRHRHG